MSQEGKKFSRTDNKKSSSRNEKPKSFSRNGDKKPSFNQNSSERKIKSTFGISRNNSKTSPETTERKSFEKKDFSRPTTGKRIGKTVNFDSRKKYINGDKNPDNVVNNKVRRPLGNTYKSATAPTEDEKIRGFILQRKQLKLNKTIIKESIRLNKYIANAGICSRREADELIKTGLVEVNGVVVTEMGYQVQKTDYVRFDSKTITPEKPVYVLLNKPKGYISTTKDDKSRKTVLDLTANASPYRLYPVGRLDRSTMGVILLTNDGHMTKKLTHPSSDVKKIYHVVLDRKVSTEDFKIITEGVRLEEGIAMVDSISYIEGKPKNEVGIELHIGWNRVVRRIFQKLGYEVESLDRVFFAGLTKKNIKRGHWRILSDLEVNNLKML